MDRSCLFKGSVQCGCELNKTMCLWEQYKLALYHITSVIELWSSVLKKPVNPEDLYKYKMMRQNSLKTVVFFHVPIYSGVCLSGTLSMFQYILGCVFCMSQYIQGCVFSCANISGDEFLHVQKGEKVCWE